MTNIVRLFNLYACQDIFIVIRTELVRLLPGHVLAALNPLVISQPIGDILAGYLDKNDLNKTVIVANCTDLYCAREIL